MIRKIVGFLILVLIVGIGYRAYALVGHGEPTPVASAAVRSDETVVDATAPLTGLPLATKMGTLDLRRYRGHVVYVNFFASWCPPCNAEAPALAALARTYAAKGLIVVGVDEGEGPSQALAFRNQYALPYPIAVDASGSAGRPFGASALPTQVIFDRHGALAYQQAGMIDPDTFVAQLNTLLAAR